MYWPVLNQMSNLTQFKGYLLNFLSVNFCHIEQLDCVLQGTCSQTHVKHMLKSFFTRI